MNEGRAEGGSGRRNKGDTGVLVTDAVLLPLLLFFAELELCIEGPKNRVAELELSRRFNVRLVCDCVRVRVVPEALGRRRGEPDSDDVTEELDVVRVRMVRVEGKATVLALLPSFMRGVAVT